MSDTSIGPSARGHTFPHLSTFRKIGPPSMPGESLEKSLEELARFSLGTKMYVRVNWKDVQTRPGRLDLCEHWKIAFDLAKRYDKRLGLRVMMSNPDIEGPALGMAFVRVAPAHVEQLGCLRGDRQGGLHMGELVG